MDTKKLRQKILDLAIRGKLVPQDPNDEPASVLLERIRAEKEQLIKEGKIKRSKKSAATDKSHYENVPFEIPESWAWVTLSEVCEVARGGSPRPIKDYLTTNEDGVNWIKIGDTDKDGKYINSTKEKIIPEGVHRSRFVHKGDFLLTNSMSFGRPYILNIDGCIHDGWLVISPFANTYVTEFLYFLLSSSFAYDQFADAASGGVVSNLNSDKVANSYFPLPPEREQRRIINELNNWFKVVGELDKNIQGVKSFVSRIKSKILDLAISGKLAPQDPDDEPAIELLKRIHPDFKPCDNSHYENLPFEIPSTWVWVSHNDMLEISGGAQPPKSEFSEVMKPGYIRLYQIRDYGEKPIPIYIPLSTASKTTVKGDILLARYGGSLGKVFIAEDGAYNVAMAKVILCYPEILNQKFVYYYYLSSIYQNKLRSISRTAQAGFNSGDFEDMYFPLPPLEEQGKIVDAISSIWEMIDMITAEL